MRRRAEGSLYLSDSEKEQDEVEDSGEDSHGFGGSIIVLMVFVVGEDGTPKIGPWRDEESMREWEQEEEKGDGEESEAKKEK